MDIYFAGAESPVDWDSLVDAGVNRILNSFFHLQSKEKGLLRKWLAKPDNVRIFLDCGAFSYFSKGIELDWDNSEDKKKTLAYLNKYLNFINTHGDKIFAIFNFDIDPLIGYEIVREWDEKYFKPLEKYVNVFYVHHHNYYDTYQNERNVFEKYGSRMNMEIVRFTQLCKEHKRVALSELSHPFPQNPESQFWNEDYFTRNCLDVAKKYNRLVHGLAQTKNSILEKYVFYSVDSSTWLGGGKYGTTYHFDGNKMRTYPLYKKSKRKEFYPLYERWGLDIDKIAKDERNEVNKANIIMWKLWSVFLCIRKAHRLWWLSEDQQYKLFNTKMYEFNQLRKKGVCEDVIVEENKSREQKYFSRNTKVREGVPEVFENVERDIKDFKRQLTYD